MSNMCNFDQIRGTAKPLFVIFMFMRCSWSHHIDLNLGRCTGQTFGTH